MPKRDERKTSHSKGAPSRERENFATSGSLLAPGVGKIILLLAVICGALLLSPIGCTCARVRVTESQDKRSTPMTSKWELWNQSTKLRGANFWQKKIIPELDGSALGDRIVGPTYSDQDFANLADLGANYINLSHPGLFTETPPYKIDKAVEANLDELIAKAKAHDLFVVISFRTGPGRNELSVIEPRGKKALRNVWSEEAAQKGWAEMWKYAAERYKNEDVVVGYDLMVEPNSNDSVFHVDEADAFYEKHQGSKADWAGLALSITRAIRSVDAETPIIVGGMNYSHVTWLEKLRPTGDPRTVYAIHQYDPYEYTHQKATPPFLGYPKAKSPTWNKETMAKLLEPVSRFKKVSGAPVVANEFGVVRWSPGAAEYLADEMELFEKNQMNYAIWLWESGLPTISYDEFNYRHGTDPKNHKDVPGNVLLTTLKQYFAKNDVRPSQARFGKSARP